MADSSTNKHGMILSSGSANGAYEVGVMEALFTGKSPSTGFRPLNPQVFSGSSIGAFNAAFLVSKLGKANCADAVADLKRVWAEEIARNLSKGRSGPFKIRGNIFRLFDPHYIASNPVQPFVELAQDSAHLTLEGLKCMYTFALSDLSFAHRLWNLVDPSVFVSIDPFLDIINKTIQFESILQATQALRIIATNWSTGHLQTFSNSDFTSDFGCRIIQASSAMPGLFPKVRINDQTFVDAAVLGYATLAPVMEAGAFTLHLIYPDPELSHFSESMFQSSLDTLYRVFIAIWTNRIENDVDTAHKLNHLQNELDRLLATGDLTEEKAQRLLEATFPSNNAERLINLIPLDRKLAIHRYFSQYEHARGILNFNQQRIEDLTQMGFDETTHHDCKVNGCILPEGLEATFPEQK